MITTNAVREEYTKGDIIRMGHSINNGFWKTLWHFILRKPLQRIRYEYATITDATANTITYDCSIWEFTGDEEDP